MSAAMTTWVRQQDGDTFILGTVDFQTVGWLIFCRDGEVLELEVHQEHRRKGYATGLWAVAKSMGAQHSMARTDDGDAWAHSLGEVLPIREEDPLDAILRGEIR